MQNETFRVCEQTGYFVRSALEKTAAARNGCLSCWNGDGQLAADKRRVHRDFAFRPRQVSGLLARNSENNSEQIRNNSKVIGYCPKCASLVSGTESKQRINTDFDSAVGISDRVMLFVPRLRMSAYPPTPCQSSRNCCGRFWSALFLRSSSDRFKVIWICS